MSILAGMLKMFFGTKSDKDSKDIQPFLDKIKAIYPEIEAMTNDRLRERAQELKQSIADHVKPQEEKIAKLKAELEAYDVPIEEDGSSVEEAEKTTEKRRTAKHKNNADDISNKETIAGEIDKLKEQINNDIEDKLNEILPEAFAIMKDTARRFKDNEEVEVTATDFDRNLAATKDFVTIKGDKAIYSNSWSAGGNVIKWDMVHYDVQLFGGAVLHKGKIAEMATGEGKTLMATLPVFLNALAGKGVHIVTVNDYLARRDSEWMGPMYQFHGLSVDCIDRHQPNSDARRKAYNADITFGTNNEFGFDYLRDNMAISYEELVQREHHFAIVDEVDSVLIDDARTPLIISGPAPKGADQNLFKTYNVYIEKLYARQKELVTQMLSEARKLIAEGNDKEGGVKLFRAYKGLPKNRALIKYLSEPGMKVLMQKTENVYMADNNREMYKIVDDLYFVIDEKNNSVELTDKGHEFLAQKVGDADFFLLPNIGVELSNLKESKELSNDEKITRKDELLNEYTEKAERMHMAHQLLKAYSMFERDVEYVVMDNQVKIVDEQTGRVLDGRRYSDGLHQAIEAKENLNVEAATQTYATVSLQNYFRMYHKLAGMTGTAETEASEFWAIYKLDVVVVPTNKPVIRDDRNDVIYKTKREKYAAVIDETGRLVDQGRPVLVGTTSVEVSELISRMLKLRGIKHNVLNAKQHQLEAQVVAEAGRSGQVTIATNMAGRGTDIKLSPDVKEAGGLAIVGTERHESRRVDRQLRGRAGRQGDPGSSQFFVSLEDDLMRLFGSARIAGLMDRMGIKEGESIQAGMMTKAIERAQKRVEENNFGIRKHLLDYDDVNNQQRQVVYATRRNALKGERLDIELNNLMINFADMFFDGVKGNKLYGQDERDIYNEDDYATDFTKSKEFKIEDNFYDPQDSLEDFKEKLIRLIALEPSITEHQFEEVKRKGKDGAEELKNIVISDLQESITGRTDMAARVVKPTIDRLYKEQGSQIEKIYVPMTDGKLGYNVSINLKNCVETNCQELYRAFSRNVILSMIDENWRQQLRDMDDLRQSVQTEKGRDQSILEYKIKSFMLFHKMLYKFSVDVLSILNKGFVPTRSANDEEMQRKREEKPKTDMSKLQASRMEAAMNAGAADKSKPAPAQAEPKVGRNDPCPCGSGKKYKHCHGKGV